MADIRNWQAFKDGRWPWARMGVDDVFPGRIGIGDIDGFVELRGHHLFIESKGWSGAGDAAKALDLPTGQRIALESIASHPRQYVLLMAGEASEMNPLAYQMWMQSPTGRGVFKSKIADLRLLPREQRVQRAIGVFERFKAHAYGSSTQIPGSPTGKPETPTGT